jgi:hypothetical protein
MLRDDLRSGSVSSEDSEPHQPSGPAATREWALMFYMAGDNDLSNLINAKVTALVLAGSNDNVGIAVQSDRGGSAGAERRTISSHTEASPPEPLGAINTGDKKPLIEFIEFASARIPARRRVITIWNHGRGLDPHGLTEHAGHSHTSESHGARADRASKARTSLNGVSSGLSSALFPSTVLKKIEQRLKREIVADSNGDSLLLRVQSIAFDFTSKDHLDNQELQEAISTVAPTRAKRVDIVAFEACLMNTIEVAYQLRESVKFIVGSQSNYPQPGWPYRELVSLFQDKNTPSREVAIAMTRLAGAVTAGHYLTASALDLSKANALAKQVSKLADKLTAHVDDPAIRKMISYAHASAQAFADSETIDLAHFCTRLLEFVQPAEVRSAATATISAVRDFVIHSQCRGADVRNATGISIFFPRRNFISPHYAKLDFARETTWNKFLERYLKLVYGTPNTAPPPSPPQPPANPADGGHAGHGGASHHH